MGKKGIPSDHFSREDYISKCIGNTPPEKGKEQEDPLGIEALNKNMETKVEEVEKPKKGRPKKVTEESTFEG